MPLIGAIFDLIVYNPMLNGLLLIYTVIPNYGVAIILFTILVALLTMPFRIKSQAAMKEQQAKQAALKPKLDEIKKKYKDNPQQLQAAQMKLYQEHGLANPLNSGCLLQLLPFPIFIGLYNVITAVMGDKPEQLMQLSQHLYPAFPQLARLVPVNSNFLGLNLGAAPGAQGLPSPLDLVVTAIIIGLVVGTSWVQQKMMTMPTAQLDPQQAQMNQSMQMMTPLIFGFFVINAPVGLAIYWITFGVIGIAQQYFTSGWGNLFSRPAPQAAAKPKRIPAASEELALADDGRNNGREDLVQSTQSAAPSDGQSATPTSGQRSKPKSNKGKKNRSRKP